VNTAREILTEYELHDTYPTLNIAHIARTAADAAATLTNHPTVEAIFAPNDDTIYRVIITLPPPTVGTHTTHSIIGPNQYLVALPGTPPRSSAHPWNGQPIHWTYASKWVAGPHSQKVLAIFLRYLSEALHQQHPQPPKA